MDLNTEATLTNKGSLPKNIKQSIVEYQKEHGKETIESEPRPFKISESMCNAMQKMYENGMSGTKIADEVGLSSDSTAYYHLNGKCNHSKRSVLTYDDCGWAIKKAKEGTSTSDLADEYGVSQTTMRTHLTGRCQHEHGLTPLTNIELIQNATSELDCITTECEVCGEEIKHKPYKDRKCCGRECGAVYAHSHSD